MVSIGWVRRFKRIRGRFVSVRFGAGVRVRVRVSACLDEVAMCSINRISERLVSAINAAEKTRTQR